MLRHLEAGEAGLFVRTLLAGLVCGLLWELWNSWARATWVYTVPGFESLKVFEMPLLGFLGFPPFAALCLSVNHFLDAWRERARSLPPVWRWALRWGTMAAAVTATAVMFAAAGSRTVDSTCVPVERLELLPAHDRVRLVASGFDSPELLLRTLSTDGDLECSVRTGIPIEGLRDIKGRVALVMHRGLGDDRARELLALGIRTRAGLAGWTPERLASALRAAGARGPDRFLERRARVWLQGLQTE